MPETTAFAVAKLCRAQDLLAEAAQCVSGARLDTIRVSDQVRPTPDDFRGTDLDRRLDKLSGALMEETYDLEVDVKRLAVLIPERESD